MARAVPGIPSDNKTTSTVRHEGVLFSTFSLEEQCSNTLQAPVCVTGEIQVTCSSLNQTAPGEGQGVTVIRGKTGESAFH